MTRTRLTHSLAAALATTITLVLMTMAWLAITGQGAPGRREGLFGVVSYERAALPQGGLSVSASIESLPLLGALILVLAAVFVLVQRLRESRARG